MESNFIKYIKTLYPDYPVYSFFIPQDAPSTAFCFENAGQGISTHRVGTNIISRVIKLTLSTDDISIIYKDSLLQKQINSAHLIGELSIVSARIENFSDSFNKEQKLFERTYTIKIKYKEGTL